MRRDICQATSAATSSAAPPATMKYPTRPEVADVTGQQDSERALEGNVRRVSACRRARSWAERVTGATA